MIDFFFANYLVSEQIKNNSIPLYGEKYIDEIRKKILSLDTKFGNIKKENIF